MEGGLQLRSLGAWDWEAANSKGRHRFRNGEFLSKEAWEYLDSLAENSQAWEIEDTSEWN